jgi:multiple sugar transport system permease protein
MTSVKSVRGPTAPGSTPGVSPGVAPSPAPVHRVRRSRERLLWLLAPGAFLMTVVILIPLVVALIISTLDLDQYTFRQWLGAPFIGLRNYTEALNESDLLHAVWVSCAAAAIATVIALPIGVTAALTTQDRFRGRGLVRSVYLIPYVLPAFVVGTVWRIILAPDGVLNQGLHHVGIDPGLWLNGPKSFSALVLVQIWSAWPLIYLLTLSGLASVDAEVHEAAALDGAGWLAKLRFVILPLLRGPLSLAVIISLLHIVNSFTLPYVLFGVPAPHDVEVLPVLTYVESFQYFRFGLSAAMAVLSLLLILIPLLAYLRAVRLDTGGEKTR